MEATTVANLCFSVFAKPETAALEKTYFFPDITLHCYWYVVFQKSSSSETEESIAVLQDQRSGLGSKNVSAEKPGPYFPYHRHTCAYASVLEAGSYTVTDLADQAKFQHSFKTSL